MNTQRQNRRGSGTGEGEWLKAMFEDFTRKTAQNITQSLTTFVGGENRWV